MKSVWKQVLLGTAVALLTLQVQAQTAGESEKPEKKELPREIPSPDKEAKRETDRLKNALNLTDKQYKKVYKLVLKEQRERFEQRMEHRPPMGERPEGGMRSPHEGGMPPAGDRHPEGAPMGMNRRPMPEGFSEKSPEDLKKEMEKKLKKKNKKMKKILSEQQYDKWLGMAAQGKSFQR